MSTSAIIWPSREEILISHQKKPEIIRLGGKKAIVAAGVGENIDSDHFQQSGIPFGLIQETMSVVEGGRQKYFAVPAVLTSSSCSRKYYVAVLR